MLNLNTIGAGSSDNGIKLMPDGNEEGRPISIVLKTV
jgi:hypothetical protein